MSLFFHISDLHFGRTDPAALAALKQAVASLAPEALIVTGDLTQSGRRNEFAAAANYLESLNTPAAVVPGNHDTPVYNLFDRFVRPWRRFEQRFGTTAPRAWDTAVVSIIGVNSARRAAPRLDWSTGKLRRSDIEQAASLARERHGHKTMVFLATHHPFRLGPGKAGSEVVGGAPYALKSLADAGVSVILTGHVHDTSIAILPESEGKILSISSGSATSTRQRTEAASFTAIELAENPAGVSLNTTTFVLSGEVFTRGRVTKYHRSNGIWNTV